MGILLCHRPCPLPLACPAQNELLQPSLIDVVVSGPCGKAVGLVGIIVCKHRDCVSALESCHLLHELVHSLSVFGVGHDLAFRSSLTGALNALSRPRSSSRHACRVSSTAFMMAILLSASRCFILPARMRLA